jgi:hypothetical protein
MSCRSNIFFSACASQRNERTRLSFPPCFVFSPFYSVLVVILLVHVQPAAGANVLGFSHRHHRCDRVAEWRIITSRVPGLIPREDSRLVCVTLRPSSREPPVFQIFLQVARGRRLIITTRNSNRYYFWTSAASRVTPHIATWNTRMSLSAARYPVSDAVEVHLSCLSSTNPTMTAMG